MQPGPEQAMAEARRDPDPVKQSAFFILLLLAMAGTAHARQLHFTGVEKTPFGLIAFDILQVAYGKTGHRIRMEPYPAARVPSGG